MDASPLPPISSWSTDDGNLRRWSSFIGIIVAIVGNLLISLALNIQKYAHVRLQREKQRRRRIWKRRRRRWGSDDGSSPDSPSSSSSSSSSSTASPTPPNETSMLVPPPSRSAQSKENDGEDEDEDEDASSDHRYLSSPYWWLGLTLMSLGESGNFLAYGFAPASIVSPLGVVALISNCVIAPLLLKEPFRRRDLLGVILSICGAVTIVASAEKSQPKLGPGDLLHALEKTEFLAWLASTCVIGTALAGLSGRYGQKYILVDLGLAAVLGAYTVLCTKAISSLLSTCPYCAFTYPITYPLVAILAVTAVLQVKYVNRALRFFDATLVVPTQFVLFTLSVVVGSAVMYEDFERAGGTGVVRFMAGCMVTFCGVWVVSSERAQPAGEEDVEGGGDGEAGLRRRGSRSSVDGRIVGYSLRAVVPVLREEI